MRDAQLIIRIKDRKLNEILLYTTMARLEPDKTDSCMDIVMSLASDISICDLLLETDEDIEYESCYEESYYSRLSESDLKDESDFSSLFSQPTYDEGLRSYIKELITDAADSLIECRSEGVQVLKEELSGCRARIESLSQELDYSKSEISALEGRLLESEDECSKASDSMEKMRDENISLKTELNLLQQKISVLEPAYERLVKESEGSDSKKTEPTETTSSGPESKKFITKGNIETLVKVKKMKDSKLDKILDDSEKGLIEIDICDDIVDFLKTDIGICDAIIGIDFSDHSSVVSGFKKITQIVQDSKEPQHQDEYVASLTPEEASLEYAYAQVINSLQGMMMYMKDEIFAE